MIRWASKLDREIYYMFNNNVSKSTKKFRLDSTIEDDTRYEFISDESSLEPKKIKFVQDCGSTPRYYQINAVLNFNNYLKVGFKRLLCVSPTGTGKTLISKLLSLSVDVRETLGLTTTGKIRVLFIADDISLLNQAAVEFSDVKDSVELIIQSAYSNIPDEVLEKGWDLTFMDEAHHEAMPSMQKLIEHVGGKPLFGFTATPDRGDSLLLKFERYVYLITKAEAIRRRFISTPNIYSVLDTSGNDKVDFTVDLIENMGHLIGNTLVYFREIDECQRFYDWAIENGHTAYFLTDKREVEDIKKRFAEGEFRFLINCQVLGEGVDIKNCSYTILARRFDSRGEKEQYIGRVIRPDSDCYVFEYITPLSTNVLATDLFPIYNHNTMIYKIKGEWKMKELSRMNPEEIYIYD